MSDPRRTGVFDLGQNPELEDLFKQQRRVTQLTIRTSTIAKVVATDAQLQGFDPATQLCSLECQQPTILKNRENPAKVIIKDPTIIKNIPVYFPKGADGFLTFPINIGDTGELIIQDRDPAQWYLQGNPTDPVNRMLHNKAYGVFHPGLSSIDNRIQGFDIAATVLEGSNFVKLGAGATEFAVLGDALISAVDNVLAAATPVPQDGGAALLESATIAWDLIKETIKSLKVQVE